jgi:hypothetical protein
MIGSLAVIDKVIVSPAFAIVLSRALSDVIVTAESVGGVRSIMTWLPSVTADTVLPSLLAKSEYETTIHADPSNTLLDINRIEAVQFLPLPLVVAYAPEIRTFVFVSAIASSATIVSVIVSPTLARLESIALSDAMLTLVSAGGVLSISTALVSVVAVTVVPALLAKSANVMATLHVPSDTADATTA